MTRRTPVLLLCLSLCGVAASLLGGCVSLHKAYPAKRYYMLEAVREPAPSPAQNPATLRIGRVRASAQLPGRNFIYRTGDTVYETDFYNAFLAPPDQLIAEAAQRWLHLSGAFRHVVGLSSQIDADYLLEGSVLSLYGDYRVKDAARAVLALRITVLDGTGPAGSIVLDKVYRASYPAGQGTPDALAAAWNMALSQVLTDLETDLAKLAAARP